MQIKKIIFFIFIILFLNNYLFADFNDTLNTTAMKAGIDFITKPNDFFMEINTDIENTGTDHSSKNFQFNTSLIWNILTVGNLQLKYRVYKGTEILPEIIPGISYWNIWGLAIIPDDDFSACASGYTPFITFGKKIEENVKFFSGIKYTVGNINLKIKNIEEENQEISDSFQLNLASIGNISSTYKEFGIYTGINYLRLSGKEVIVLIGYYPGIKKLYSKIQVSSTIFDYGLSLYPDSMLLLHGYINIHINL